MNEIIEFMSYRITGKIGRWMNNKMSYRKGAGNLVVRKKISNLPSGLRSFSMIIVGFSPFPKFILGTFLELSLLSF